MAKINLENLDSQAVPFFARFLENQDCEDISAEEMETVNGGCSLATRKYPSDNEEVVTKKYPSDTDEFVTLKYPSDGEDSGTVA
ncbi:MAG TPA: microviridin/marinostatin family tricyclic proteinase inhibitor [Nostocaceae cyanobacterium]|nr:microviridin/marinostatin family tricyclic proteinase inhibitor [Nostocaceae cyanobacterium]